MRIGILQCGKAPAQLADQSGDYPDMFIRLLDGRDFDFQTYHVEEMAFPADVRDADGWLLTGARHGAYEDHEFIPPLEEFIRRAHDEGVPMVGICFGHQVIAQALGGTVVKHPGGWVVGTQDYDFDGQSITLNAWHQDQVVSLPEGAAVAGQNAACENAALVYGDWAYTVQAHPEFDDAFIQGLMEKRGKGVVPQELMDHASDRMGEAKGSQMVADRIEAFFKQPRPLAKGAA